jgi:hypothetical protein
LSSLAKFRVFKIGNFSPDFLTPVTQRIQRNATITIDAPVDSSFPLFGPIREKDWAHGWNPEIIYPQDVLVDKHMIFRTHGGLHGSQEPYTWVVVNYEPEQYFIEYMVSATERLWFITVKCAGAGQKTRVTVTYSYTGFTPAGIGRNAAALEEIFASDLKDWERAINHYITTGKQLTS